MLITNGELDYHVWVRCPECQESMDLVDQDCDHDLVACIFGSVDNKADWKDTGLIFQCPFCEIEFELGDIEY
jgi:hypothetical protein